MDICITDSPCCRAETQYCKSTLLSYNKNNYIACLKIQRNKLSKKGGMEGRKIETMQRTKENFNNDNYNILNEKKNITSRH